MEKAKQRQSLVPDLRIAVPALSLMEMGVRNLRRASPCSPDGHSAFVLKYMCRFDSEVFIASCGQCGKIIALWVII
jgi:hypothetical protein